MRCSGRRSRGVGLARRAAPKTGLHLMAATVARWDAGGWQTKPQVTPQPLGALCTG